MYLVIIQLSYKNGDWIDKEYIKVSNEKIDNLYSYIKDFLEYITTKELSTSSYGIISELKYVNTETLYEFGDEEWNLLKKWIIGGGFTEEESTKIIPHYMINDVISQGRKLTLMDNAKYFYLGSIEPTTGKPTYLYPLNIRFNIINLEYIEEL